MRSQTDWQDVRIASPYDDSPDAEVAGEDELSLVANTGQVAPVQAQRFNANLPYAEQNLQLDSNDKLLLEAIKRAVTNGWEGWRMRVNDATTVGLEAEQLVKEMKKYNADAKGLLFDQDFARFLWGNGFEDRLRAMVTTDVMRYLKENL